MQPFEQIKKYSAIVCEQINWKKAKSIIAVEIENHLCDQRDAYMADGESEEIATIKAISQMGDAAYIGQELNKTHKPKSQPAMLILTIILMSIGMLTNYFIDTSPNSLNNFSFLPYIIALCVFISCYFIDFTLLGKYPIQIYITILTISIIMLLLSTEINGRLYLSFSRKSFSLSYLSLLFPFIFALFVYAMRGKRLKGIIFSYIAFFPIIVILVIIPSFTGIVLFTITSLIILCYCTVKGWFCVRKKQGLALILIPMFTVILISTLTIIPSATRRLSILLNPEQDINGAGYIYNVIRKFLSESVLFGKGNTPQDLAEMPKYLTNISFDYSLVYLAYEFGTVFLIGIIILLLLFVFISFYKIYKHKSVLGSLLAISVTSTFLLQSLFYIINNFGYGLSSSLSLPFISYGNSALLLNAALIGFMLSAFRTGDIFKDSINQLNKERNPIFSYQDGKLIIDMHIK